jgi:AraC family transcriptional regulator of adaptative response/methylated-DNA-[protein]-cysteine methyltransferase
MQYLHKTHVRQRLIESAAQEADVGNDLNTNSGLADLQVSCEALTPKKYQRQVQNLNVRYGWHPSPFGPCFIAISQRGIVKLAFAEKEGKETIQQEFQQEWGVANCRQDSGATASLLREIFTMRDTGQPIHLLLKGTHFQLKVWLALLKVPLGQLTTYARLAQQIEQPQGVRAVGSAVAKNPIAFLIPCHRVIRKSGEIHHYRWGTERKHALIGWEQAQSETRSLPPDGSPD